MTTNVLSIPYPEDLLLSIKRSPEEFDPEPPLNKTDVEWTCERLRTVGWRS